jgi:hypothetical protein
LVRVSDVPIFKEYIENWLICVKNKQL